MMDLVKIENQADLFMRSGLFSDVKKATEAMVKIQAGAELGFQPIQAMQGIDIIQGKVYVKPLLLATLVKRSGKYNYRQKHSDSQRCEIEFLEFFNNQWESIGISTFTIEDAAKMNLSGRDNWKKQPANMLFYRALSQGIKHFCPDVISMPIYTEGDYIESNGNNNDRLLSKLEQVSLLEFVKREGISEEKLNQSLMFFGIESIKELNAGDLQNFKELLKDEEAILTNFETQIEEDEDGRLL